jgi:hypothetical protein
MKLLIVQSPPASRHFLSLNSKYDMGYMSYKMTVHPLSKSRKTGLVQSVYWLGYELDDQRSNSGSDSKGTFSLRHSVQTGSEAHPTMLSNKYRE